MTSRIASTFFLVVCGCWPLMQAAAQSTEAQPAVDGGARFEHRIGNSRFDVGGHRREQTEGPHQRVIGDRGVFYTDAVTGATLAVLHAPGTPKGMAMVSQLPHGLTNDPDRHSAEVRRYLVSSGIPAAEVSGTHVTTTMAGGGPVSEGVQASASTFLWYTTHLERSLNGIPVEGSFAFAALDTEGKAITEGVYWPAIPADVVHRANALKRKLESADEARAFQGQLHKARPDVQDTTGEVRIVHTGAGHHGGFEAHAVYSVVVRNPHGGKAEIVRFDDQGAVVQLADEKASRGDSVKLK